MIEYWSTKMENKKYESKNKIEEQPNKEGMSLLRLILINSNKIN